MSLDPLALRSLIQQWRNSAKVLAKSDMTAQAAGIFAACADQVEAVLARSGEPSQIEIPRYCCVEYGVMESAGFEKDPHGEWVKFADIQRLDPPVVPDLRPALLALLRRHDSEDVWYKGILEGVETWTDEIRKLLGSWQPDGAASQEPRS